MSDFATYIRGPYPGLVPQERARSSDLQFRNRRHRCTGDDEAFNRRLFPIGITADEVQLPAATERLPTISPGRHSRTLCGHEKGRPMAALELCHYLFDGMS